MGKVSNGSFREAMVPLVCAIHCIVTPIASPALSVVGHNSDIEYALFAVALIMAGTAFGFGLKHHRKHKVWCLALLGFSIWGISLSGSFFSFSEAQGSMIGSFMVAGTLLWNGHLRHQAVCGKCICPIHRD